ncbi:MAG: T9SS type A sorting domain-containing protein, partial [candidate division WOR-3 bacterium]
GIAFIPQEDCGLKVYDVMGRVVKSFNPVSRIQNQTSIVVWDGKDNAGCRLSPGVYFVQFKAGADQRIKKVVLCR